MNIDTKIKLDIIGLEVGKINVIKTTEYNVPTIYSELKSILGSDDIQLYLVGVHYGPTIPEIVKMFDKFDYTKPIIIVTNKDSIYKHVITRPSNIIKAKCPSNGFLILESSNCLRRWKFSTFNSTFYADMTIMRRDLLLDVTLS
jgi:hypothetical protein